MAISNAALAQQLADLLGKWTSHEVELAAWASGAASGGPYGDGRYPLTGPAGTVLYLPCPAALAAQVSSTVSGGAAYAAAAELAKAAAEAAQAGAFDARDLALAYKVSSEAARDAAQTAATAAANSEANALVHEQAAGTSAASSADSAAAAAQAVTDAGTARDTAATSAADAYGSASAAAASAATAQAAAATAQAAATGALHYKGSWDATTGFPAGPVLGDLWKVSVAAGDYSVGDQIIYNGSGWDKIDNTEAVTSVAGRVGPVVLGISDITLLQMTLDAKLDSTAFTWSGLYGKPTTFAPSAHTHDWSNILNAPATATRWADWTEVTGKPTTFTPSAHTHTNIDRLLDGNPMGANRACTITDWNAATTNGCYTAANAANNPTGDNTWYVGQVTVHNVVWITQEVWSFTSADVPQPRWVRNKLNGSWGAWYRIDTVKTWVQSGDPGSAAKDGDLWIW